MRNKRMAALCVTAVMAISVLEGCGKKESPADTTAAAKEGQKPGTEAVNTAGGSEADSAGDLYEVTEPVTIEYWYNGSGNEEFYKKLAEDFHSSHENITVVPVCGADYNTIGEKLTAAQAAGTGLPGLCLMSVDRLPVYMESGVCEPLDGYCEYYGVDTSDFVDAFMDGATYEGVSYAFPHGVSVATFYYNKDELSKVGLDKFPSTWDEFRTWCREVYEKTGKTAYTCACMQNNILYNFAYNWGGVLIKEDGTTGFDSEVLKQYIREMKELVDAGYVEWSLEGVEAVGNKFLNGDTMCMNISCTSYSKYTEEDFYVGMAWNYMGEHNISSVAGSCMFIPAQLDQMSKNAAFLFAQYLSSPDINFEWAKYSSYLATHKSTIADEAKMEEIYKALPEMRMVYANSDHYIEKIKTPYFTKAMKPFMEAINQIILEDADFDEAWNHMLDEVNYVLAGN